MNKDGGSAFPRAGVAVPGASYEDHGDGAFANDGMTMWDWYFGKILAGLLAGNAWGEPTVQQQEQFVLVAIQLTDRAMAAREQHLNIGRRTTPTEDAQDAE